MKNHFCLIANFRASLTRRRGLAKLTLLGALLSSLVPASGGTISKVTANSASQKMKTLVGVVSSTGDSEWTMDAVVIVEHGKLISPYADEKEDQRTLFAREYFSAGRKYRLTFGGGDAGTATIRKWDTGCNNIHATVEAKTTAKLTDKVMALATNSETLGTKQGARRALTAAEHQSVMQMVKQIYTAKGTPAAMLRRMTTTNLTATDLDGDGKFELVGSFVIATGRKFRRDLFLIAEPQGVSYKAALVDYQAYKLQPEGFDSAINFVDQLDLDGDGIGEVFAVQGGFDAYGYAIYKKGNGRWRKVYEATGDAC